ncbi:MAG: general secretion pathway protein GspB [Pseudomonadales bacterium]
MSFILDAIKKSENERQRSKQPDVHSLQDSAPQIKAEASTVSRLVLLLIAISIIVVASWWLWLQVGPQISPRLVAWLEGVEAVDKTPTEAQSLTQEPVYNDSAFNESGYKVSSKKINYTADSELPPNNQIKELWEQPADYQSTIPELDFSFHVFSDIPKERMIIINGRRMREGQVVSRGLTLRVITETGVILHYGDRFFHVDVIEKW